MENAVIRATRPDMEAIGAKGYELTCMILFQVTFV